MDKFTEAYMVAALWSSTDMDGEPLDDKYGIADLAPETREQMEDDCREFQLSEAELLEQAYDLYVCPVKSHTGATPEHYAPEEMAGHDFWLTRCGHGVGFWDRGLGDVGDKLTDAADRRGTIDLYIGDDGLIYGSG